ncbi:MAG TPA: hypothetical protein V6D46_03760 [Coleofasciculaceae cyanobacterium]
MGDRAMMSAYYPKSGQRPEDNVRAIADALAVYLAWSFRNSITQVKKATPAPTDAPASPLEPLNSSTATLRDDSLLAETVISPGVTGGLPDRSSELPGELPVFVQDPAIEPSFQRQLRFKSVNLKRLSQRRRSKLHRC